MPGVRVVAETVPSECTEAEKIERAVEAVLEAIVDALTRPLSREEAIEDGRNLQRFSWIVVRFLSVALVIGREMCSWSIRSCPWR